MPVNPEWFKEITGEDYVEGGVGGEVPVFMIAHDFTSKYTSWPSAPVTFCMVPPPSQIHLNFVYNFFVPDEATNTTGYDAFVGPAGGGLNLTSNGDGAIDVQAVDSYMQLLQLKVPRYVTLGFYAPAFMNWNPGMINVTPQNITLQKSENNEALIRTHMGTILDDSSISTNPSERHVGLALQPNNLAISTAREIKFLQPFFDAKGKPLTFDHAFVHGRKMQWSTTSTEGAYPGSAWGKTYSTSTSSEIFYEGGGTNMQYVESSVAALEEMLKTGGYLKVGDPLYIGPGMDLWQDLSLINLYSLINAKFIGDIMLTGARTANKPIS